jgi:damage-control phosphatase, subfamily III
MTEIATTIHTLSSLSQSQIESFKSSPDRQKVVFKEMLQICLWFVSFSVSLLFCPTSSIGEMLLFVHLSTVFCHCPTESQDLSLLTHLSEADIATLQRMDASRNDFILRDDQDVAWGWVQRLNGARIDIILDNGLS